MFLEGYGVQIAAGAWITIKLALLSLAAAVIIGLLGASAKLSPSGTLRRMASTYTTLVRSVPDLVIMLLLFYSLQMWLNQITEALEIGQIEIDPFVAGVVTLGFIYGAYFTETFRAAFMSVPKGQVEAAAAYGISAWKIFWRVSFPQMMRFALPGVGNNWQVLIKATALVSIIGLTDLVKATQNAGKSTMQMFYFGLVAGAIYLLITTVSGGLLLWLEKRYSIGYRSADL